MEDYRLGRQRNAPPKPQKDPNQEASHKCLIDEKERLIRAFKSLEF